jgi:signal transduction histidine kinase
LINEILDLSRIEAGRVELNIQPVDVMLLADECADALASIVQPGVELQRELAEVSAIQTDEDRLRQILMNLLGNATKFTTQGRIALSVRAVDEAVEIAVADTGVGIPPEDLPHIFEEFRQVDRVGAEAHGTGLGLTIVMKTVELLGGEIRAESTVDMGTTFTIKIGSYSPE